MRSRDLHSGTPLVDANSGMFSLSFDGSVDWPRTIRLAEFAIRDGITHTVVTTPQTCFDALQRRMTHLSGLLNQRQLRLQVVPAIELSLQNDLFELAAQHAKLFDGPLRRYVFLRLPVDTILPVAPIVKAFTKMGLATLLLAPERHVRFQRDVTELRQIVSYGGLIQLSAASLSDETDRRRIKFCRQLIRQGLCHVVASESGRHHDLPISLRLAFETVSRWAGRETANALCMRNPSCVFSGDCVEPAQLRRSGLQFFSRAA